MTRFPVDGTGRLSTEVEHPTAALTGPAGGDLTGSFPNPTITTVNGHAASAVVSTTTAPGNRLAVSQEAPLNVEWPEYAADPVAGDNTAAIQAALNALPAAGGELLFPRLYTCTGTLTFNSTSGRALRGLQGGGGGPRSGLVYTGTGTRFLDARSSSGCIIERLGISYTSPSFAGVLIDFTHDGGGSDAGGMIIRDNMINGDINAAPQSAKALISLDLANIGHISGNFFGWALCAIRGGESGHYSNAHTIDGRNSFQMLATAAIMNAGDNWVIDNNVFEGTDWNGAPTLPLGCLYADDRGWLNTPLTFSRNWYGDLSGRAQNLPTLDFSKTAGEVIVMSNQLATYPAQASIKGNYDVGLAANLKLTVIENQCSDIDFTGATGAVVLNNNMGGGGGGKFLNGAPAISISNSGDTTTTYDRVALNQILDTNIPAAVSGLRGQMISVVSNTGADTLQMCLKSAVGAYSWKTIVTG